VDFQSFHQFLKVNTGIIPWTSHDHFLPSSSSYKINLSSNLNFIVVDMTQSNNIQTNQSTIRPGGALLKMSLVDSTLLSAGPYGIHQMGAKTADELP
jgi:hypothetical protein